MKTYTREELTELLIEKDLSDIERDPTVLRNILKHGRRGYDSMSHEDILDWFIFCCQPEKECIEFTYTADNVKYCNGMKYGVDKFLVEYDTDDEVWLINKID